MGISILRLMSGFFRFLISVSHVRKQFYAVQKGLHLSEKLHMISQMQLSNILFLFGGTGRIILTIVTVVNGISFVFSTMIDECYKANKCDKMAYKTSMIQYFFYFAP
jgi:hypothetical protein